MILSGSGAFAFGLHCFVFSLAVGALPPPAGQPVQLQVNIKNSGVPTHCATVNINASGFAIFTEECVTNPSSRSWIVNKGGASSGAGAAGHIRVWNDYCIDVPDGVNQAGTELQIWKCATGNKNQLWEYNSDNSIQWAGTNKCIDLRDGQNGDSLLQIWNCSSGNPNQIWAANPVSPAPGAPAGQPIQFQINDSPVSANRNNGPCISVEHAANGSPVVINGCLGQAPPTRSWVVEAGSSVTGTGPVGPIKFNGTFCLDVPDGVDADGTKLQIWECAAGNKNQMWQVNSDYTIKWANHNKCADLTKGLEDFDNPIQIWTCNPNNLHQQWIVQPLDPFIPD